MQHESERPPTVLSPVASETTPIEVDGPDRRSYETPTLTLYGDFRKLTQGFPFGGLPGEACIALANENGDPYVCSVS